MDAEQLTLTRTIDASPEAVFAVLADPATHPGIDGTGWVKGPVDPAPLTEVGQLFRMAMYHRNHPDGDYQIANKVEVLDAPRAIGWIPGQQDPETGEWTTGGWTWRYDLESTSEGSTKVTLTYDWSKVPPEVREIIQFPAADHAHLERSLEHLAELATRGPRPG